MADEIDEGSEENKGGEEGGKGGKTIPMTQFLAALNNANKKYDNLEAKFNELAAAKEKPAPVDTEKRFTRAELKAAVAAGQVTEEQSDALWEKQVAEDVTARVTKEVLQTVGATSRQERITNDLAEYKRLAPEILETDSEKRKEVAAEFAELVSLGQPKTLETELLALRAVYGPLDKLRVAKSGRRETEFHEETGGGEGRNRAPKALKDTLTERERDYYDGKIKSGMYKDWKEVEAELAYARPDVRRKAGARV